MDYLKTNLLEVDLKNRNEPFYLLSDHQVKELLILVKGWEVIDGKLIRKTFSFSSYLEGAAFSSSLMLLSENLNHHPDILISFKDVTVEFYTHNISGLSLADFVLAKKTDYLVRY